MNSIQRHKARQDARGLFTVIRDVAIATDNPDLASRAMFYLAKIREDDGGADMAAMFDCINPQSRTVH